MWSLQSNPLVALSIELGTPLASLLAAIAGLVVVASVKVSEARARLRVAFSVYLLHLVLVLTTWLLSILDTSLTSGLRTSAAMAGTLASVTLGSAAIFEGVLLRLFPRLPRIVPDLATTAVACVALMRTSSQLGFELSGVIATSAVLTAVLGLALQDTLGNALGGLALQFDASIKVGDHVRLGDVSGRVSEIRWRYTALETASWDTIIVPNRLLMRGQVVVMGRRRGQPVQCRREVRFRVDYHTSPSDVIRIVEEGLRAHPIANMAKTPAAHCIAEEFGESQVAYALRYWVDPAFDILTDSQVRGFLYFVLARAHIGLSVPARRLFVTADDEAVRADARDSERARRVAALRPTNLFGTLTEEDLNQLADRLERVPFAQGETITREGEPGQYLYMIRSGAVSVRVGGVDARHEIGRLQSGDFFGEMALLTGKQRTATSIALSDVECYRLDSEAFGLMYARHNELAEHVAKVFAERETGLVAARERLSAELHAQLRAQKERAFTSKIRAFFERM